MIGLNRYITMINGVVEQERLVSHDKKGIVNLFVPPIPTRAFNRYLKFHTDSLILKTKKTHLGIVLICTTRKCPFNCRYCSAHNTPNGELTVPNIEKIIGLLKKWGVSIVGFTGGEPLLRKDTDSVIEKLHNQFSFIIFTSGYGLTKERALDLKNKGLFAIAISLDDYDKRIHNQTRGSDTAYGNSLQAIRSALHAKLYTIIQTVVTDTLLKNNRLDEFLKCIKRMGVDESLLLEPLATGKLLPGDDGCFLTDQGHQHLNTIHKKAVGNKMLPKIYSFANIENKERFGCGAGIQHAYIDAHGDFWPCNFLPISLGNVLTNPNRVYSRLTTYFPTACDSCIIMSHRHEFQKLYRDRLPIKFEKAQPFLEKHRQKIIEPAFYRNLKG